ncbi:MAG: hypothetical protein AAGB12_16820 [Pseudomonadota bacterium]
MVASRATGSLTATLGSGARGYDGAFIGASVGDFVNQAYEVYAGSRDSISVSRLFLAGLTGGVTQYGVHRVNDLVQGNWLYDFVASSRGLYSGSGGVVSIGEDVFSKALNGGVFGASFATPLSRTTDQYLYEGFNQGQNLWNNRHLFQYQPPPYQYMNAEQLRYLQQVQQQGGR